MYFHCVLRIRWRILKKHRSICGGFRHLLCLAMDFQKWTLGSIGVLAATVYLLGNVQRRLRPTDSCDASPMFMLTWGSLKHVGWMLNRRPRWARCGFTRIFWGRFRSTKSGTVSPNLNIYTWGLFRLTSLFACAESLLLRFHYVDDHTRALTPLVGNISFGSPLMLMKRRKHWCENPLNEYFADNVRKSE
jgi:hypothetical protein